MECGIRKYAKQRAKLGPSHAVTLKSGAQVMRLLRARGLYDEAIQVAHGRLDAAIGILTH